MCQEVVKNIETYNFPRDDNTVAMLSWMGDDYVGLIIDEINRSICSQVENTHIIALKLESKPEIETHVSNDSGKVISMDALFELQVLLRNAEGHTRLNINGAFLFSMREKKTSSKLDITSHEKM